MSDRSLTREKPVRARRRTRVTIAGAALVLGVAGAYWLVHSREGGGAPARAAPPPAQVVVSHPVERDLAEQLGFLGQFSAVQQVELRAQVGGTLTEIGFKDGDIVRKGDLLFAIDPRPYAYRLSQSVAQLESATAKLALANRELVRAQVLKKTDAGTLESVDQRLSEQHAAQADVDQARAQIQDAQFDLEHCRIEAPFTGRIGTHLVSVGNLVAGSRGGASPTTLLATLVSVDPIYLDFDMSESDALAFARARAKQAGGLGNTVQLALSDETAFSRRGTLDFVDNVLDRSSGTLHARATVPNQDGFLTPGEFARVRLILGAPSATLLVPDAAVLPDQSEHIVLTVAADGTVTPKQVETGDIRDGLRVIHSGLAATDRVIIEGLPYAAPGSKVTTQDGTIQVAAAAPDAAKN